MKCADVVQREELQIKPTTGGQDDSRTIHDERNVAA